MGHHISLHLRSRVLLLRQHQLQSKMAASVASLCLMVLVASCLFADSMAVYYGGIGMGLGMPFGYGYGHGIGFGMPMYGGIGFGMPYMGYGYGYGLGLGMRYGKYY